MSRLERSEKRARMLAEKSNMRQNVAAVIVGGGKILGKGFNRRLGYNASHHAEVNAINSMIRQKRSPQGADIHIYRFRADGSYGLSKPCKSCLEAIIDAGIKRVFYSDYDGTMKSFKVDEVDMESYNYHSRGQIHG